jgi:hypothetical protein
MNSDIVSYFTEVEHGLSLPEFCLGRRRMEMNRLIWKTEIMEKTQGKTFSHSAHS